jgi:hypothetical protein
MTDKYTLDKCKICGEHKALKNGVCQECNEGTELPECFKDIFGGKL